MLGHQPTATRTTTIVKPLGNRLCFLDNLKVFLTVLVILHHVGQAYGPTGGFWQYRSSLHENWQWLGLFFRVNAGFFMGLFFLISGYFMPGSLDRKGPGGFIREKATRFGIPVLLAVLVMVPLEMYFHYANYSGNKPLGFLEYYTNIYLPLGQRPGWFKESIGWPEMNFGHLWFVEHLLVYSGLYALYRRLIPTPRTRGGDRGIGLGALFAVAAVMAVATAAVRNWYPIDSWVGVLGFIQVEPAHLPQYAIMFTTGMLAYRKGWIMRMPAGTGSTALALGGLMALVVYSWPLLPDWLTTAMTDHWDVYESFMAVFLGWGLIWLFRERANRTGKVLRAMADNAYAAYFVHYPIVLAVQYSLDGVHAFGAPGKFALVSVISVTLSFLAAMAVRRVPLVRRVL